MKHLDGCHTTTNIVINLEEKDIYPVFQLVKCSQGMGSMQVPEKFSITQVKKVTVCQALCSREMMMAITSQKMDNI